MKPRRILMLAAVLTVAPSLWAEGKHKLTPDKLTPGNWQITVTREMPGAPFTPPPTTTNRCLTPAEAAEPQELARSKKSDDCQSKDIKQTGNKLSFLVVCNRRGQIVTGIGELTFAAEHYSGTTTIEMNDPRAGHIKLIQHTDGKHTGDCEK
jgi:uncharacterized protein DUF3617